MLEIIKNCVSALRKGEKVLLVDDSTRQNSAYILASATSVSAEDICFMANHGGGVVMAAISEDRAHELGLTQMAPKLNSGSPDLTVSVEARQGVSTGISAQDRARTLRTLAKTK